MYHNICFLYEQVLDPPQGDDAGPASRGAFGIQAGAELTSESYRLWSALAETSHAAASRFSRMVSQAGLRSCQTAFMAGLSPLIPRHELCQGLSAGHRDRGGVLVMVVLSAAEVFCSSLAM